MTGISATAPSVPHLQRAVVQDSAGQPVLTRDAKIPELQPETLLVKTVAVALNQCDYKMGSSFPTPGAIIGTDFAGIIIDMGPGAAVLRPDLRVGDNVFGLVYGSNPAEPNNGTFAEFLRVPAQLVFKGPATLESGISSHSLDRHEKMAAMGVGMVTAALAVWDSLRLPMMSEGSVSATMDTSQTMSPSPVTKHVLVYGASTASGTMALQLLQLSGYVTIAACSPHNFPLVKEYGAAHVLDYADPEAAREAIRQVLTATAGRLEHVLDCITDRESVAFCYSVLPRTGGRYTTLEAGGAELAAAKAKRRNVKHEFIFALDVFGEPIELGGNYERPASLVQEKHEIAVHLYTMLQRLVDDGKLRPHPLQLLKSGFEGIIEGLKLLKSGSVSGKKLVVSLENV